MLNSKKRREYDEQRECFNSMSYNNLNEDDYFDKNYSNYNEANNEQDYIETRYLFKSSITRLILITLSIFIILFLLKGNNKPILENITLSIALSVVFVAPVINFLFLEYYGDILEMISGVIKTLIKSFIFLMFISICWNFVVKHLINGSTILYSLFDLSFLCVLFFYAGVFDLVKNIFIANKILNTKLTKISVFSIVMIFTLCIVASIIFVEIPSYNEYNSTINSDEYMSNVSLRNIPETIDESNLLESGEFSIGDTIYLESNVTKVENYKNKMIQVKVPVCFFERLTGNEAIEFAKLNKINIDDSYDYQALRFIFKAPEGDYLGLNYYTDEILSLAETDDFIDNKNSMMLISNDTKSSVAINPETGINYNKGVHYKVYSDEKSRDSLEPGEIADGFLLVYYDKDYSNYSLEIAAHRDRWSEVKYTFDLTK